MTKHYLLLFASFSSLLLSFFVITTALLDHNVYRVLTNKIEVQTMQLDQMTDEISQLNLKVTGIAKSDKHDRSNKSSKSKAKTNKPSKPEKITASVILTAYHPQSRGINSDSTPDTTATMTKPVAGRTCAISSTLVRKGWLGKKIYIEGYGVYKADDRMSTRAKGDRIDICVGGKKKARAIGKNHDVFVSMLL